MNELTMDELRLLRRAIEALKDADGKDSVIQGMMAVTMAPSKEAATKHLEELSKRDGAKRDQRHRLHEDLVLLDGKLISMIRERSEVAS